MKTISTDLSLPQYVHRALLMRACRLVSRVVPASALIHVQRSRISHHHRRKTVLISTHDVDKRDRNDTLREGNDAMSMQGKNDMREDAHLQRTQCLSLTLEDSLGVRKKIPRMDVSLSLYTPKSTLRRPVSCKESQVDECM